MKFPVSRLARESFKIYSPTFVLENKQINLWIKGVDNLWVK